jgi:copper chaperone CopZ
MIELSIEGMSCMHCVKTVTEALAAVKGVEGTPVVTLDPGGALVEGNVSTEELIAAVKESWIPGQLEGMSNKALHIGGPGVDPEVCPK